MRPKLSSIIIPSLLLVAMLVIACTEKNLVMTEQTPLKNYKLAMVQMEVEAGKPDANLGRAAKRIAEAAAHGASIALLPEVMDLG